MKKRTTSKMATALALTFFPILTGCGSSGSNNNNGAVPGATQTVCSYVNGQQVCTQIAVSPGGCVPISQPIFFAGTGVTDTMDDLAAGQIPSGGSYGALSTAASTSVTGAQLTSHSDYATTLTIGFPSGIQPYIQSSPAIMGVLSLSPMIQQQIAYYNGGSAISPFMGMGTIPNGTVPCVNQIALQGHMYLSGMPGFGGNVYLYLNNTGHGYYLPVD